MRYVPAGSILISVLLLSGCHMIRNSIIGPRPDDNPLVTGQEKITTTQLVSYLNQNSERLQSLRCDDVKVTGKMGMGILRQANLEASMACEQPRNFRMNVYYLGRTPEVEIGSNQDEFWYWVRRAKPAAQVYCSYNDFHGGKIKSMPFPFQPEWVLETMGMAEFGPADKYQLVEKRDEIHLVERAKSPQGDPVRKVIVFNRRKANVSRGEPQIKAYLLLDDTTGKEICSARIHSAQYAKNYALIPKRMELRWPKEDLSLTLSLVNPQASNTALSETEKNRMFVRRKLSGIPSFNLARRSFDAQPSSVQRTRADVRWRAGNE